MAALLVGALQDSPAQDGQQAAAAKQLERVQSAMAGSIQQQVAHFRLTGNKEGRGTSGGFFVTESRFTPPLDDAVTADCNALSPLQIESLVTRASRTERVGADLIRAVIRQESGDRPCAVSTKGAVGLMQLMPGTATDLGVSDALDPEANVLGGARLLRKLLDRYDGDMNRALGAYNAGPARVDEYQGVPPFPETMNYVETITRALENPSSAH